MKAIAALADCTRYLSSDLSDGGHQDHGHAAETALLRDQRASVHELSNPNAQLVIVIISPIQAHGISSLALIRKPAEPLTMRSEEVCQLRVFVRIPYAIGILTSVSKDISRHKFVSP